MIDGGIIELNAHVAAPSFYLVSCEVRAVIGDDAVGDTITVYDPGYEVYHWSGLSRLTRLASIHLVNLSTMTNKYFFSYGFLL